MKTTEKKSFAGCSYDPTLLLNGGKEAVHESLSITHSSAVPELVVVVLVPRALSLDTILKRWVEEETYMYRDRNTHTHTLNDWKQCKTNKHTGVTQHNETTVY